MPAFLVIPFADRIGRKLVFLVSLGVTAFLTFSTAFAQTPMQFVLLQMATRTFFVSGAAVAFVMIAEEFPAAQRGWGIGMLGALGACGHGFGAALFALVDHLPYGWRALYAVGVVPLPFLPVFRKRLPETKRFEAYRATLDPSAARSRLFAWIEPLQALALTQPSRAVGVALVASARHRHIFGVSVHGLLHPKRPRLVARSIFDDGDRGRRHRDHRQHRRWAPGRSPGRRFVGFALLGLFPLFVTVFYRGPSWVLPMVWVGFGILLSGGRVIILRAVSTELFPTSHRSAAAGLYTILETAGASLGLLALWVFSERQGDFARIIPYLSGVGMPRRGHSIDVPGNPTARARSHQPMSTATFRANL